MSGLNGNEWWERGGRVFGLPLNLSNIDGVCDKSCTQLGKSGAMPFIGAAPQTVDYLLVFATNPRGETPHVGHIIDSHFMIY